MKSISLGFSILVMACAFAVGQRVSASPAKPDSDKCVACHANISPNVVNDWKLSKHAGLGIGCEACHGTDHTNANDAGKRKY